MVKDSCGNNRTQNNILPQPFFYDRQMYKDELFKRSLSWTAYEGFQCQGLKRCTAL